jgi:predicted nucleic acid-binding protein
MTSLFLDTSYLIAVEYVDDQKHREALKHWRSLSKKPSLHIVTTSYVFDEVITFLNDRRLHSKAVEVGRMLLSSRTVSLVHVDEELFDEAWSYFQKHKDKRYSMTDCVSFVLMKQLGIKQALTFDRHFKRAGFIRLP